MEKQIRREAAIIARMLEAELNKQKPFSKRVRVKAVVTASTIEFVYSYPEYGNYLDLGTERYRVSEANRKSFNKNPGTGIGGIKPRFWMSINTSTKTRINMILKSAFTRLINEELKKAFKLKK